MPSSFRTNSLSASAPWPNSPPIRTLQTVSASAPAFRIAYNQPRPLSTRCHSATAPQRYGCIYAALVATGRKAHGPCAIDLLIAATAIAANLPLYTRNLDDFRGIEHLLTIVGV
jgi:hypothetical protein